jgi:hypothetical protein
LDLCPYKDPRRLAMCIDVVFGQQPQLLGDIPAGGCSQVMSPLYQIPESVYRYTY